MLEKIKRQVEQLEKSMGTGDGPPFDIELVFVEPVEGCFGGRIKRVVRLSELANARSQEG
jgi:hypothetical protein